MSAGILVDRELRALLGNAIGLAAGAPPFTDEQVQPTSLDLRLGPLAHRIRASFLPGKEPNQRRLEELESSQVSLAGEGSVLERGLVYLVPLEERLALPAGLSARFNPRSSTGRCDIFTRVLCDFTPRFDEAPEGYRGDLWLEIAPLSFPVRLARGDRLTQMRLARGRAALSGPELAALVERIPLAFAHGRALGPDSVDMDAGVIELHLGLEGRDPCGWRAVSTSEAVHFSAQDAHATEDFWEPVHARGGRCVLEPGNFYVFASREKIRIAPDLAAEMLPVHVELGELRNNYAGFFDAGFGWQEHPGEEPGTPAVLEVRVHDVPFLVEDGQVFSRLQIFRTSERPERIYGEGRRGPSYRHQDLTLARPFRST